MRSSSPFLFLRALLALSVPGVACSAADVVETRDAFRWVPCDRFVASVLESVPPKPPDESSLDSEREQVVARLHESAARVVRLAAIARSKIIITEREIRKGTAVIAHISACREDLDAVIAAANEFVSAVAKSGYGAPSQLEGYLVAFEEAVSHEKQRLDREYKAAQPGATDNPGDAQRI